MRDIEKNSKKNDDEDFYQEIEEEERGDHTTSCITLVLFCMIVYAVLIWSFWKISPWFWQVTDRAATIRSSIKIPTNTNVFGNVKNKAKDTVDKTKNNLKNQAQNKVQEGTNSAIDSAKDQAENAIQQQNDQIQQGLNNIPND